MCFGAKDEEHDQPARPARQAPAQQSPSRSPAAAREDARSKMTGQEEYAPPPGPPPGRSGGHDEYAPPPGPPPGRSHGAGGDEYAPPPGPPPGHSSRQEEYSPPSGPPPGLNLERLTLDDEYAPPSGPPPGHSQGGEYALPPGPPPGHARGHDEYAPPPGSPPGHSQTGDYAPPPGPPPGQQAHDDYAPPPGPPPSHPKHDWEVAVPDTSLFPPPPAIFSGFDRSPSSNASEEEAAAGEEWCEQYPLTRPMFLDQPSRAALTSNSIQLIQPAGFSGKMDQLSPGHWSIASMKNSPDRCFVAYPPLYLVNEHLPTHADRAKTIYYEVKLAAKSREVFVAMGFTALPYPSFRMPGWHRGSLAVHGDDGHKYINDRWGGKDFTEEFRRGDTYGVGMTFTPKGQKLQVDIFFTRNGRKVGEWDLHEETDAEQDLPVTGLEGFHDLSCAVGTYDGVSCEVVFDPARWMYRPS